MNETSITIQCINELGAAEKLWNLLSPNQTIFDSWEFRFCFYKYFNYPIHFYVAFNQNEPVALLPLQFNTDKQCFEFIGGFYMEDNRAMTRMGYESIIPLLYKQVSTPACLEYVRGNDQFTTSLPFMVNKYILDMNGLKDFENYLQNYHDTNTRGKFRRKIKKISALNVTIEENNTEDIELLFEYNKNKFKENSFFHTPHSQEIFRDLTRLSFKIHLTSFVINGTKEAVSFGLGYKDTFEYLNFGVRSDNIPNLTSFINMHNIEMAIQNKYRYFDAFIGDYGWKEHWHLDKTPQYIFKKNA